jgi:hypothetical protein
MPKQISLLLISAALTTVVVPAGATTIFAFGSPTCTTLELNATVDGSCSGGLLPVNPANGFNGVTAFGTETATEIAGNTIMRLSMSWTGSVSGSLPDGTTLPTSWDFTVTPSDPLGLYRVTLYYSYTTTSGGGSKLALFTGEQGTFTFSGSGDFSMPDSLTSYGILLIVQQTTSAGGTLTISVPEGSSADFNPASTTPEPTALLLIASGLGLLFLRKRLTRFSQPSTLRSQSSCP